MDISVASGANSTDAYKAFAAVASIAKSTPTTTATYSAIYAAAYAASTTQFTSDATFAAASAASAASKLGYSITAYIRKDLKQISQGGNVSIPITSYGEIWGKFLQALREEECTYWGEVYQQIFNSGFEIDQIVLDRRLNVPEEIREQGAAVVGRYLVSLRK